MFNALLYQPLLSLLLWLTQLFGSLGLGIIGLTAVIRAALIPLTLPAMKTANKMRDLKPQLDGLKKTHGSNKTQLQQAQLELFKQHQVNPASGCLPYLIQFVVLIALYQVFINYLSPDNPQLSTTTFLWFDLTKPDPFYLLPVLAAVTQLILGLMVAPAADTSAEKTLAQSTPTKTDDSKAEDMTAMAATMQKQMLFVMPLMTGFIALKFPSGLSLYWVVSTILSIVQQAAVSGWGGFVPLYQKYLVRR